MPEQQDYTQDPRWDDMLVLAQKNVARARETLGEQARASDVEALADRYMEEDDPTGN